MQYSTAEMLSCNKIEPGVREEGRWWEGREGEGWLIDEDVDEVET